MQIAAEITRASTRPLQQRPSSSHHGVHEPQRGPFPVSGACSLLLRARGDSGGTASALRRIARATARRAACLGSFRAQHDCSNGLGPQPALVKPRCYHFWMDFTKVRNRCCACCPGQAAAAAGGSSSCAGHRQVSSRRPLPTPRNPSQTCRPQCIRDEGADDPPKCKPFADDYLECLHHRKYVSATARS